MAGVRYLVKDTERDKSFACDEQSASDCAIAPTGALRQTRQLTAGFRPPHQRLRYWRKDPSCEPPEGA
jgi:hypothetical protein